MIVFDHLTLRRGAKVLLEDASARIAPGEKVALIGRNGVGKSSLFALLAGELHEDGGSVHMPAGWRVAQVAQHAPDTQEGATDFVLAGDTQLTALRQQLAAAERAGDGIAIAQAHAALIDAGALDARARAKALITGLGFAQSELERPVNSFSGGWRMRLQLARALMAPSDALLLDEPTNHLDLDALVWLEGWLARYAGTLIAISHDRDFLDAACSATLHMADGSLRRYTGGYSAFEKLRATALAGQQAERERQQARRAQLQRFVERFRYKASKARQAQSRLKALEKMQDIPPALADGAAMHIAWRAPDAVPDPMLTIQGAAFGYRLEGGGERRVLHDVTAEVRAGQRIGILGANGQGKSTFIKTIARTLARLAGEVREGKNLAIGYFAQHALDALDADASALAHMQHLARRLGLEGSDEAREGALRTFLGSFHFSGDMVQQAAGTMSGGEKARLVLAMLVWQRPALLLLDEPTNHLDLPTREALADALNSFDGTLMLVSHDRALLRSVCDEFWLVAGGGIVPFEGDLHDYRRLLLEQARQRREALKAEGKTPAGATPEKTEKPVNQAEARRLAARQRAALAAQTAPLKKRLTALEARMAEIAARQNALHELLAAPITTEERAAAGRELKELDAENTAIENEWLQLSEEIEALEHGNQKP